MTEAIFVLSTGRCGTQWLASVLSQICDDSVEVKHEPLGDDYAPRAMLEAGDPAKLDPDLAEPILAHVDDIEQILRTRSYIECGYPSWSTLPYFIDRFPGRVRVIHLVRHPVPTAWSWVTQSAYCPPLGPHLREKVLLSPFDKGVHFASFRKKWDEITPYEKALFYWAEVNAFGLRLQRSTVVPWLTVRFEDLLRGEALARLVAFANLDAAAARAPGLEIVDEFRAYAWFWCDPRRIENHPEVLEIADALGYDPLDFDEAALRRRYVDAL
jgi:hypothetical protein